MSPGTTRSDGRRCNEVKWLGCWESFHLVQTPSVMQFFCDHSKVASSRMLSESILGYRWECSDYAQGVCRKDHHTVRLND